MTILLAQCYRLPWLSNEACTCMGVASIVVAALGTLWVAWWVGRA